ncbi:ABC transporter permease [Burkholderia ubonensis]|uniref:ABC transporter permease n=1 Tax=Burkholderia ubonensis TaxID=101571 RepID=UPI00075A90A9|nr:ABC transporter permease subunit [Burkholderia ubonensis]KVS38450.1 amino acid ABC transporter permease [Burkholderia ubonensis]KVS42985.1 amino acid ABC transporter permease [Burkholderia ubonensis]KVS68025.1 amino acid ABC transporter permease [Burkholderia ubonensis]KVS81537.1 amino acid ABC transporter permease [Burkholderia ubonensis]KVS86757.1 amino acid ABC transporter permease [Burkholderia ubonensis]
MDILVNYGAQIAAGALVTLELAVAALCVGMLLGIAGASAKLSSMGWLRHATYALTNFLRGIPEFLILLICYFGLSHLLNAQFDGAFVISPFSAGVIALAVVFGAYSSEMFRGAFIAVPAGQIEAARAYGMTRLQTLWYVRLPQAWRICLPSLNNMWQNLLKDTSLVSIVGLEDMLRKANIAAQFTKQPFVFYVTVGIVYFGFLAASNPVFAWLERIAGCGYAKRT